jgi:NADPH:quinone reductase-like Zn-dependent oxidoreductase
MRAIVQERYGPPDAVLRFREVAAPAPRDGEVLVRVRAAAVVVGDWRLVRGSPVVLRLAFGLRRPRQPVPGMDMAGVVEAVGEHVQGLRPGDEVFGRCSGAFAELVRAEADLVVPVPSNATPEQAATIPESGCTALQGLRDHGRVQPGQRVLVIGASGGVGTWAVQIARVLGAEVTGVCSGRSAELVRSLGAHHVIDYATEDVSRGAQRYDVILQLAGTASPARLRRILAPSGTLVLSKGDGRFAGIDRIAMASLLSPFVRQRLVTFLSRATRADLLALRDMVERGQVTPVIDRTYPLAEAAQALRHLEDGHPRGRVVVTA